MGAAILKALHTGVFTILCSHTRQMQYAAEICQAYFLLFYLAKNLSSLIVLILVEAAVLQSCSTHRLMLYAPVLTAVLLFFTPSFYGGKIK